MSHALVVDDKESGRRSLRAELEDGGFDVTVAASAHDALKALEDLDPSLIVTDFQMPDIDGIEFLRRVRAFSDVPIVSTNRCTVVNLYIALDLSNTTLQQIIPLIASLLCIDRAKGSSLLHFF